MTADRLRSGRCRGIVVGVTPFVWVTMAFVTLHSYRHVSRLEEETLVFADGEVVFGCKAGALPLVDHHAKEVRRVRQRGSHLDDRSRSLCPAGVTPGIAPISGQSSGSTHPRRPIAGTGGVRLKGRLPAERENESSDARDKLPSSPRRFFPGARTPV